ncbi:MULTISPECIES: FitA-like ribbon-helix-helix domain-containing protein [Brevibacterium]|uniref:FitA-like ribbon-helix-helix domain-containing protein n=1 Tax=Brevibacterium TaxID=1696 RepID=UPI00196A7D6C|nr:MULTISPECIES: hypothetical protein [Brevibacterium]
MDWKNLFSPSTVNDIIELISGGGVVEQILIRNLPEGTKAILRRRAAAHHSSIEAEAREALAVGIAAEEPTLVDLISMPTDTHFEFEPKRLGLKARSAEL